MSNFRIRALVEDRGHESMLRGLLDRKKRVRDLRIDPYPRGIGAGEQHVRTEFPAFVSELRAQRHQFNLWGVVVIDGDREGVQLRRQRLLYSLAESGAPPITPDERFVLLVPTRNTETWAWHLLGHDVDETTEYKPRVEALKESLRRIFEREWNNARGNEPSSLTDARLGWARVDR